MLDYQYHHFNQVVNRIVRNHHDVVNIMRSIRNDTYSATYRDDMIYGVQSNLESDVFILSRVIGQLFGLDECINNIIASRMFIILHSKELPALTAIRLVEDAFLQLLTAEIYK